jgi:hydrogenase maturation protease
VPVAPTTETATDRRTILVGGVGELYQGDLHLGHVVLERLSGGAGLAADVLVEDLGYGAVAVLQRLQELRPRALVLVGAARRGRRPGTVEVRRVEPRQLDPEHVRQAVAEAVTGYVSIDLVLEVAQGFRALPPLTVVVEVEPARTDVATRLSPSVERRLEEILEAVRGEVAAAGRSA